MDAGDLFRRCETSPSYLTRNSGIFILKEAPILSLKGVQLTPVCICPHCGVNNKSPWSKSRGRLRDWAAFLEEVKEITCSNESCASRFVHNFLFEFPSGITILHKSIVLKEMIVWFERTGGQTISMSRKSENEPLLLWDPFFQAVPDWADSIPLSLFTNILFYTPPFDLEGILLERKGSVLFGGCSTPEKCS